MFKISNWDHLQPPCFKRKKVCWSRKKVCWSRKWLLLGTLYVTSWNSDLGLNILCDFHQQDHLYALQVEVGMEPMLAATTGRVSAKSLVWFPACHPFLLCVFFTFEFWWLQQLSNSTFQIYFVSSQHSSCALSVKCSFFILNHVHFQFSYLLPYLHIHFLIISTAQITIWVACFLIDFMCLE